MFTFALPGCVGLAALSLLLALASSASAAQKGRSIEFSGSTTTSDVSTNLHQLTSKKDTLKEMEEDLYKPIFSPKSSLDGVAMPQVRPQVVPMIQSKRVQELIERRKNWMFMKPEDLMAAPTAEDIFKLPEYGPDGMEKKKTPALQRYLEDLDKSTDKSKLGLNRNRSDQNDDLLGLNDRSRSGRDSSRDSASNRDSDNADGLPQSAANLKKLFEADPVANGIGAVPESDRNRFSDIFGLADKRTLTEQATAQKMVLDEFKHDVLGMPGPSVGGASAGLDSLTTLGNVPSAAARSANPLGSLGGISAGSRPGGFDTQLGTISPIFTPSAQDNSLRVPTPASITPVQPKVETPRLAPPTPNFTAPRRTGL
jgi:hypothetical protein